MENYAVVKIQGQEYLVTPEMTLSVNKIEAKENEKIDLSEILLLKDGNKLEIGKPFLTGQSLKAVVISQYKGEKIDVYKYKSKARYRRHTGFRAQLTKIKIENFGTQKAIETNIPSTAKKAPGRKTVKPKV